jgi:DnaK suppressor protein
MKNSRFEELKAMLLARRDVVVVEVSRHAAKLKEKKTSTDSAVLGLGTEDETVVQLAEMYSHEFQAIDAALGRLTRGAYGICGDCGDPIELVRLEALPFTTTCIRCKMKYPEGK